jgi:hypothetical protein
LDDDSGSDGVYSEPDEGPDADSDVTLWFDSSNKPEAWSTFIVTAGLTDTSKLVRKYLPPGTVHDQYMLYLGAQALSNEKPASYSTFNHVYKTKWTGALKFREKSMPLPHLEYALELVSWVFVLWCCIV